MPRPSKHVSPDTLGGRIRAAREHLQLSLADVAHGHYSTSLISQIERNRIEPSQESLRYLADRLHIPLSDLELLARQQRETESEAYSYKSFEELRQTASQLLSKKDTLKALSLLLDLHFPHIPPALRWRLAALRGQCYFEQRKFLQAQQDFVYAVNEHPKQQQMSDEQKHDFLLLHLHLAGTYRELQQLEAALEHYHLTLQLVNKDTPFGYVAEIHWGLALIAFHQAQRFPASSASKPEALRSALKYAENARFLYRSIGEQLRAATVTCQIAQIEQSLGLVEKVCGYLEDLLATWSPILHNATETLQADKHHYQEIANVVSSTACLLAGIAMEAQHYEQALAFVDQALTAGKQSYKLRRAEAYLMRGRILEAIDLYDSAAEEAFQHAIDELHDTHRIAARIGAHVRFGRHLLKKGKTEQGEQELEQARLLTELVSHSSSSQHLDDVPLV